MCNINIECNEVDEVTWMIYKWAIELSVHCLLNGRIYKNRGRTTTNDILLHTQ